MTASGTLAKVPMRLRSLFDWWEIEKKYVGTGRAKRWQVMSLFDLLDAVEEAIEWEKKASAKRSPKSKSPVHPFPLCLQGLKRDVQQMIDQLTEKLLEQGDLDVE